MKKTGYVVLAALVLSGAFMSCGKDRQAQGSGSKQPALSPPGLSGDALAFSKFTQPVEVHIGMSVDPLDSTMPRGDTPGNNQYTRYLLENYNIKIVVDWTAALGNDYEQKVSLCIASNTLPDGLVAYSSSYMLKAAKSDMLYDISDLFQQYASNQVKGIFESTNGRAMDMVSYNGKMIALPHISATTDGISVLNVQKNWLDQYGLPVPKTVDDIEQVARVFKQRQPAGAATVPIVGPDKNTKLYATFMDTVNMINGFDPVFFAYDTYPGFFLDNGNGSVSYGSLDPRMKAPLQRLAAWYKEGLIDPEMGTRDNSGEPVNANQAGMRFGPWWGLGYANSDSFRNNPHANWQAYPVLTNDGKWNSRMKAVGVSTCLISKKASADAAAAIIIMYNALVRDEAAFDRSLAIEWYPLRIVAAPANGTEYEYRELTKVLNGETQPEDYNDPAIDNYMYHDAQAVRDVIPRYTSGREMSVEDFDISKSGDFNRIYALMIGNRPFATRKIDKEVYSVTYSMTDLLEQRWPNLWKMEQEVMMKIVTGQVDISAFDKFVSDWKAQGGQGILDDLATQFLKK